MNSNIQLTADWLLLKLTASIFKQVIFHLVAICTHEHKALYKSLKPHFQIPPHTHTLTHFPEYAM